MCCSLRQKDFHDSLQWWQRADRVPQPIKHIADLCEQLRQRHLTARVQRLSAALTLGFVEKSTHFLHEFIVVEEDADSCLELVEFKLLEKYFRLQNVIMFV